MTKISMNGFRKNSVAVKNSTFWSVPDAESVKFRMIHSSNIDFRRYWFFLTIINDQPNSLIIEKHPKSFKSNYGDSLTIIDIINYSLLESNYGFISDVYCQQLDELHIQWCKIRPTLFNPWDPVMIQGNAQTLCRVTLQRFWLLDTYSPDLMTSD